MLCIRQPRVMKGKEHAAERVRLTPSPEGRRLSRSQKGGVLRYCSEHKIKLLKIDHLCLSRVCSETVALQVFKQRNYQILLCCFNVLAKISRINMSLKQILDTYMNQLQFRSQVLCFVLGNQEWLWNTARALTALMVVDQSQC
ncbi:uncharacterized protein LOC126683285 isoform X2 [Mercurialis annua]|uniref:uncharacterized protein LOC126683285 isoform X2 n=1 Tax=Mercurialis annua TaxID=3986 RepID=UPI0021606E24|nr:uncharacterized protein LOC126683285 isoform X2 [Mercurialis annua]